MNADLITRLRAGTVTPADLDAAADALERMALASREVVDAWNWWVCDQHDRCQSVPSDAVCDLGLALAAWEALK